MGGRDQEQAETGGQHKQEKQIFNARFHNDSGFGFPRADGDCDFRDDFGELFQIVAAVDDAGVEEWSLQTATIALGEPRSGDSDCPADFFAMR